VTTKSDPAARFAPNVLSRDFEALAPNTKWVADVTDQPGPRLDGSSFPAVLDLFSRAIVGWAMATIQDEALVTQALQMALARARAFKPICCITLIVALNIPVKVTSSS
jgi:transposase InsO family protein